MFMRIRVSSVDDRLGADDQPTYGGRQDETPAADRLVVLALGQGEHHFSRGR